MKSLSSLKYHSPVAVSGNVKRCVFRAWEQYEAELFHFLLGRLNDREAAEDLRQELFVRVLQQGHDFCTIKQPKAWLYRVARNALIDRYRTTKVFTELSEALPVPEVQRSPVESLDSCLWRNLAELSREERAIIEQCDLFGIQQKDFAAANDLSLSAVKARLLRARRKLKAVMTKNCQVGFDATGRVCCHKPR